MVKSDTTRAAGGVSVSVKNLWKVYGPDPAGHIARLENASGDGGATDKEHTAAVRDVSFEVVPGETFVVMGLSGSGKSTLVRCLTRLIEPTAGEVEIDGRSVTNLSKAELRDLRRDDCAMVFQHFGLLPHRSVVDNVAYGLQVAGVSRRERQARAEEVLELVGLAGWESKYPSQLSGGMRQRVGLARALAVGPRLLLLDEPFSALDPLIRRELQDELMRLAKVVKQTSIFITHDMAEALKVGDRIAIMRDGQVVQIGTPEDILLRPADEYVRKFGEDASRLRVVQAHTVCREAIGVDASMAIADARERLRRANRSLAYVLDEGRRPVGTASLDDLHDGSGQVGTVAKKDVACVHESDLIEDVVKMLVATNGHVAVVDDAGALVGEVDERSVLGCMLTEAPTPELDRLVG